MEHHKIVTVKRGLAKIVNRTTGEEVGYLERVDMPHNDLRMGAWVAYRSRSIGIRHTGRTH